MTPRRVYQSQVRTLAGLPPIRRDLIKRRLYLVPNSIVVSRGCPHVCDFCYKEAFFEGGNLSTRRPLTRRWPRSIVCRDVTCTSSMIICSAIGDLPRHSSTACAAWAVYGRRQGRSTRCWRRVCSSGQLTQACEASSWGSRRSIRRTSGAAEVPEPETRLCRRDAPPARPRRDDQRQLRVRHGCTTVRIGLRPHRRLGGRTGHRDGHVPHPDAVSGHRRSING